MATLLNLRFGVLLITVHPSDPGRGAAAGGEAGARRAGEALAISRCHPRCRRGIANGLSRRIEQ
jgi:hypothetical protein